MFIRKIIILMIISVNYVQSRNDCLVLNNFLTNFNNFQELNFTDCKIFKTLSPFLIIKPNKPIILDNSFNLTGLTIELQNKNSRSILISIHNLKGIDLESNPFSTLKTIPNDLNIGYHLYSSHFDFYHKNILVDSKTCDSKLLKIKNNFISNLAFLDASHSNNFEKKTICPLIFHEANIYFLYLTSANGLIVRNVLSFQSSISPHLLAYMNTSVKMFHLTSYHADLDYTLLNNYIFRDLEILSISGMLNSIQTDLFKSFLKLRYLEFNSHNIKHLFTKNSKWLTYLNYLKDSFDLKNIQFYVNKLTIKDYFQLVLVQINPKYFFYDYPNEDFCYFKDYPHHKLVLPLLIPIMDTNINVSCTFLYLTQFSQYFTQDIYNLNRRLKVSSFDFMYYTNIDEQKNKFRNIIRQNCTKFILDKSKLCNILKEFQIKKSNDFYLYLFDFRLITKFNMILFELFLNPIFCIICLFLSILFLYILSNKKIFKNNLKNYTYLKFHYYFISFYFFISFFKLFYACILTNEYNDAMLAIDNFCPNNYILTNKILFYLNIVLIKLISSSLKTCSCLFYLLFSIDRYIRIADKKTKYFKEKSVKYYIAITLVVSFLINLHLYFQFKYNKDNQTFYSSNEYVSFFSESNDYTQDLSAISLNVLKYLNIIKIIFSDFILIFVGIFIDFKLYLFIKNKPKIASNLILNNKLQVIKKQRKETESQKRVGSMIILNGLNSFLLRTPFSIFSLYGFVFRYEILSKQHFPNFYFYAICRTQQFCNSLISLTYLFYLLSFVFQFFIFFKLDKNFKESFNEFYKNFKKKFKKNQ